jgi:hypothetical protein
VRHKLAAPVALAAAVVVFFGVFLATRSLLWPPLLAIAAGLGAYLMVDDRSSRKVASDDYDEQARQKVGEALGRIARIRELGQSVIEPSARLSLESACDRVPELFERVRVQAPNSLYSTASQLNGHLASLEGAVGQYLDIQRNPLLYPGPEALKSSGEQAFKRFADFALDSVRLVNQGDIAQYRANLDTAAPLELPDLR